MGMPRHCIKLIAIILLGQLLIQAVTSVAVIKIRFLYYSNQRGWLYNGHRCDNRFFFGRHCDPFFTIKLTVSGETFRYETDREKGANTVYFGSKIVNIDNPIVNRIENYQGHLDISVRVDDFDSVTSNDYMGSFHHRFSATAKPFGDLSAPTEVHLVDNGMAAANLALQISVQCEVHYYGSDCSKFCQPRSDYNGGHYYCDMDGNKICKPTYNLATGCREKFCSSEPCKNGGRCIDLPDKFVCKCRPSFGGATCIRELQPCQYSRPCQNGGTCIARVGCACPAGFHGDACQLDVDECRSISPCRGKGSVCENWFGTYSCHCGPGWRGRNCTEDIDECRIMGYPTCFNGGNCENTPGSFTCRCPSGFSGRQCQEDVDECRLDSGPCSNETEVCQNLLGGFVCMCRDGFQAPNCTQKWPELLESLSASIPLWPPVLVAALAVSALTAILAVFRCSRRRLRAAFSGPSKDSKEYSTTDNPVYSPDERGDAPDELYSYNEPQEAADVRRPVENTGQELPPPLPPRPLNFAAIRTRQQMGCEAEAGCHCGPGWRGQNCTEDIDECSQSSLAACFNGGKCENTPGSFTCHCPLGYRGEKCEEDINECAVQTIDDGQLSSPCNGNGSICEDLIGDYKCVCGPGWRGQNCTEDIDECALESGFDSSVCLNGGTCRNILGGFVCLCPTGFSGEQCQDDVDECANQAADGDNHNLLCHGNGSFCKNLPGNYSCICGPGWTGRHCTEDINECELNDSSAICLNDGVCVNLPGSFKCQCKLGFRGDHCANVDECTNQFDHQSLLCNGNGSYCKNLPGNYSCICGPGWTGRHCAEDIDECKLNNYTTMCLNGGVCANLPGSFECHCKTGFRGDRCQEDIEECLEGDGPCNNETHVCKNLIGSFSCLCRDGQVSPNCTAPIDPTLQLSKDDSTWWTPVIAFVIAFVITITILSSALLILLYLRPSFCHFLPFWRFRRLSDTTAVFKGCGSTEAENPVYDVGDEATLDVGNVSSAAVYEVPGPANRSNQSENRNSVIPPQLPPRPQVALIGGLPYQQMSNLSSAADSTCSYEEPNSVIRSSAGFSAYLG
uniref:Delta-like protein n=1 Tax=Macrostomum lignano TaxID=282301 RepID=A0A1I8H8I3_9PLAT